MPNRPPNSPGLNQLLAAAILLTAASLPAQSIPPATPTTMPSQPGAPATPPPPPTHRAQVDFSNHLLTVTADNSSLNQILRDISQRTGMTITGGVTDERVFGTYGPADPSTVLTTLLNGTGSNMLLVLDAAKAPHELILTPRQGGATPPSPNSYQNRDDRDDFSPQGNPRMGKRPVQQFQQPPPQQPDQTAPTAPPSGVPQPTPTTTDPTTNTTTQQSPNGVKTPQQIYEELMKMQQKPATPPPL